MSTTATDSIADVVIPNTELVRETTAFIRDTEDDLLFDHSRRVFLFGVLQGRRRGLQPALRAFNDGNKHRPQSTFGNVNADVLEYFDPSCVRDDFVDIIRNNSWTE